MNKKSYSAACVALLLVLSLGCKGGDVLQTEPVNGTVTYKGSPVEGANVMFTPAAETGGSTPAVAITDAKGHYELQTLRGEVGAGTTSGEYIVSVSKTEMVPTGETTTTPEGKTEKVMEGHDVLPEQYKSPKKSPLRATVEEGKPNEFNFDLTD